MPLCTEEIGYVAKQSNIKNKNNLKFQCNEYLFTIFYMPNTEPHVRNKVKEEEKIQSKLCYNNITV